MSVNAYLIDANTRHQVYLLRRGAGLAKELVPEVLRILEQVVGRVASTPDSMRYQQMMLDELREILAASYGDITDKALDGVAALGVYEAEFQHKLLGGAVNVSLAAPSVDQIRVALSGGLLDIEPGTQMTIRAALDQFGDKKSREILRVISDGILGQQTTKDIAGAVQQLSVKQGYQAETLVRTIATGAADLAKRELYQDNADVLLGERWVSTLDSRVSDLCMGLDGQIFPVGRGPSAPAHYNCRSVRVGEVNPKYALKGFEGVRPYRGSDGTGTVSARTTYSGFLRQQSKEFQDDVLGVEKAKLFRSGKVTLKELVNSLGQPLTIEQLKSKEGLTL